MLQIDDSGKISFTDDTTVQCIIMTTHTFAYTHAYIYMTHSVPPHCLFIFSLVQTMYSECFVVQDVLNVALQG